MGPGSLEGPCDLWRCPGCGTRLSRAASSGALADSRALGAARVTRTALAFGIFGHRAWASVFSLHGSQPLPRLPRAGGASEGWAFLQEAPPSAVTSLKLHKAPAQTVQSHFSEPLCKALGHMTLSCQAGQGHA